MVGRYVSGPSVIQVNKHLERGGAEVMLQCCAATASGTMCPISLQHRETH